MASDERKQFARYIGELRGKQNISMRQLCEGLCSDRIAMYIERGEREPGRLLREALLERLGVGAEDYECYLGYEEYAQWKMQQQILHCILFWETEQAERLLEEYLDIYCMGNACFKAEKQDRAEMVHSGGKRNNGKTGRKLEWQFYLSMLAQIRRCNGIGGLKECGRDEAGSLLEEALCLTVPGLEEKRVSELVLSIKELNLILEVEHCRRDTGETLREGGTFYRERPERYREVMRYIMSGKLDRRGIAKIYPKAVFFLCRCLIEREAAEDGKGKGDEGERRNQYTEMLKYCNRAVKILRDNGRMYFLWEILEIREYLFGKMEGISGSGCGERCNEEAFRRLREKNSQWKQVLEKVYEEFQVPRETFEYCYLYVSKGVSCTNDVIRIRSEMLGIKGEELCEGICSTKTLRRIKKCTVSPQREVVEGLFGKLGLSGELVRTDLVTGVPEAREVMERLREAINENRWKEAEKLLGRVKQLVPLDILCNRQVVQRYETLCRYEKGEIDKQEYYIQLRKNLELTFPYEAFFKTGEKYLTHEEQSCINNMMRGMDKEGEEFYSCMQSFESIYQAYIDRRELENVSGMYEFIMGYVRSSWGNMGEFDKADKHDQIIMEGCLRTRRLWAVHDVLYDRWWNYAERKKKGIPVNIILDDVEELNKCILLGEMVQSHDVSFYQNKLRKIREKN